MIPADEPYFLGLTWLRRVGPLVGRDDIPNLGYWIYPHVVEAPQDVAGYAAPGLIGEAWANFGPGGVGLFVLFGFGLEALAAWVATHRSRVADLAAGAGDAVRGPHPCPRAARPWRAPRSGPGLVAAGRYGCTGPTFRPLLTLRRIGTRRARAEDPGERSFRPSCRDSIGAFIDKSSSTRRTLSRLATGLFDGHPCGRRLRSDRRHRDRTNLLDRHGDDPQQRPGR